VRQYLTKREWADLLLKQGGRCCVAGCESEGPFHGEHSTPSAFAGGKPDQLMCVACHKIKTRTDVAAIAKAKRLSGETLSQYERRRRFGPSMKSRNTFGGNRNG
jgi:hypothetical protein